MDHLVFLWSMPQAPAITEGFRTWVWSNPAVAEFRIAEMRSLAEVPDPECIATYLSTALSGLPSQTTVWLFVDLAPFQETGFDGAEGLLLQCLLDIFRRGQIAVKLLFGIPMLMTDVLMDRYPDPGYRMLPPLFFEEIPPNSAPLYGLVLCGGSSSRMKTNKALLRYHDSFQFVHTAGLLELFCDRVMISSNNTLPPGDCVQSDIFPDDGNYTGCGPMSGLLTVSSHFSGISFFVLGCDYPALTLADLSRLFSSRSPDCDIVCFYRPDHKVAEPLITIYEASCLEKLPGYYRAGGRSLRKFMTEHRVKTLVPEDPERLQSYDTPEDFTAFFSK